MKKLLMISFLLTTTLFGYSYNDLLIKAQSAIFPKIMLLDKNLESKLVDGAIVYTIVCETNDRHAAMQIRDLVIEKHSESLGKYALDVRVATFDEVSDATRTTAFYVLNSDAGIDKISRLAENTGAMTFAYDIDNLNRGMLLSLMVEKSTVLYLSKASLQNHKVDFVDALYQIVRFANN
jgi:hypothetical protein